MHPKIQLPSPCQQRVAFFGLGDPGPCFGDFELYSLAHNNGPRSHLQSPDVKGDDLSFDLNRFNNALYTDALVAICSLLRDFGIQRAVSLCIPKRSCKVVEMLQCEMCNAFTIFSTLIQSTPDPVLCYTFLHRWHLMGVQT